MLRATKQPSKGIPCNFRDRVLAIVRTIPRGSTVTYGEVARIAGKPKAARAVGAIMRANHDPSVPCHRVVRSDGTLGGYNRGVEQKRELLREEGVTTARSHTSKCID